MEDILSMFDKISNAIKEYKKTLEELIREIEKRTGIDLSMFELLSKGIVIKYKNELYAIDETDGGKGGLELILYGTEFKLKKERDYKIEEEFYKKNKDNLEKWILTESSGGQTSLFIERVIKPLLKGEPKEIILKKEKFFDGNYLFWDEKVYKLSSKGEKLEEPSYIGDLNDIIEKKVCNIIKKSKVIERSKSEYNESEIPESISDIFKNFLPIKEFGYKKVEENYYYIYVIIDKLDMEWYEGEEKYIIKLKEDCPIAIVIPIMFTNEFRIKAKYAGCENKAIIIGANDLKKGPNPENKGKDLIPHPYIGSDYDKYEKRICCEDFKKIPKGGIDEKVLYLFRVTANALKFQSFNYPYGWRQYVEGSCIEVERC